MAPASVLVTFNHIKCSTELEGWNRIEAKHRECHTSNAVDFSAQLEGQGDAGTTFPEILQKAIKTHLPNGHGPGYLYEINLKRAYIDWGNKTRGADLLNMRGSACDIQIQHAANHGQLCRLHVDFEVLSAQPY